MTQDSFTPNDGVTIAERFLLRVCRRTFLSLWSYPGLFKGPCKELCDLLIVFENDIIIFSDKYCKFPDSGDIHKDWSRWFKRAIFKSAQQAWGAERWLRNYPNRLYTDSKATIKFPFSLPDPLKAKFHLIVVAHDGTKRCVQELGGSGSFMLQSDVLGLKQHTKPFTIGDLNKDKSFIHVLDDSSLNILIGKLDTIYDLVNYLEKKERLFRSGIQIFSAGEEELLAEYLKKINSNGEHDFIIPNGTSSILFNEGLWNEYINNPQAKRQIEADNISYTWDRLIEKFSHHILNGTQYKATFPSLQSSEKIMRIMAKECRVRRRGLSKFLMDFLKKAPSDKLAVRYSASLIPDSQDTSYVFLLYPKEVNVNEELYREQRRNLLENYCKITKIRFPHSKNIVGIASEPGLYDLRTEDAVFLDTSKWTSEHQAEAEKLFKDLGLDKDLPVNHYRENEYPEVVQQDPRALTTKVLNNPRNKLCPCGSRKKYKKCHGK